jgi:hypothetical protein
MAFSHAFTFLEPNTWDRRREPARELHTQIFFALCTCCSSGFVIGAGTRRPLLAETRLIRPPMLNELPLSAGSRRSLE